MVRDERRRHDRWREHGMNHHEASDCVELTRTCEDGFGAPSLALCMPPILVNGTSGCPDPTAASWDMTLSEGTWRVSTGVTRDDQDGNFFMEGVARYADTNFCAPICSPPKPANLWATIRMNHGVQISREFLLEMLDSLGEAIFDPDDITSIKGVSNASLDRVRADPQGYVRAVLLRSRSRTDS